jgi:Raf kinase inhibitor-like YbhB/YbcL family protein
MFPRLRSSAVRIPWPLAGLLTCVAWACAEPRMAARPVNGRRLASITVTSPAFKDAGMIPIDATCEGRDESPELVFSAMPEGTRSVAIVMDDPDAPGKAFTHLVLYALGPDTLKVHANLVPAEERGSVRFGLNDFGAVRYSGPCPPRGEMHRYRLRVFALDISPELQEGATLAALFTAMDQHILGEGTLTGYFGH